MIATPSVLSPRPPVEEAGACAVCPHGLASHDRISLRFCQATQAHPDDRAGTRGCVCPSS